MFPHHLETGEVELDAAGLVHAVVGGDALRSPDDDLARWRLGRVVAELLRARKIGLVENRTEIKSKF